MTTPGRQAAIDWLLKTDIHAQGSESARRDFARRTVDRILALAEQPREPGMCPHCCEPGTAGAICNCEGARAARAEQPREEREWIVKHYGSFGWYEISAQGPEPRCESEKVRLVERSAAEQPREHKGEREPMTFAEDWRCPDCGVGITMVHVHVADGLLRGCGKPPGYWTRPRGEQSL